MCCPMAWGSRSASKRCRTSSAPGACSRDWGGVIRSSATATNAVRSGNAQGPTTMPGPRRKCSTTRTVQVVQAPSPPRMPGWRGCSRWTGVRATQTVQVAKLRRRHPHGYQLVALRTAARAVGCVRATLGGRGHRSSSSTLIGSGKPPWRLSFHVVKDMASSAVIPCAIPAQFFPHCGVVYRGQLLGHVRHAHKVSRSSSSQSPARQVQHPCGHVTWRYTAR